MSSLKLGIWKANLSGYVCDLTITNVGIDGGITATISASFGDYYLVGCYDEASRRIVITPSLQPPQDELFRRIPVLEGYLFSDPIRPTPGQDVIWTIAGTFISLFTIPMDLGQSFKRNVFGWYAQTTEVM
jgi:hypothetical protein